MAIVIQPATTADAPTIAAIAAAVWPDEPLDVEWIAATMADERHRTFVAQDGGAVVGFMDGFATRSRAGARRWEVDLLAVRPRWHGRGIGRALIGASVAAGAAASATAARALIRADNTGSERAFAACGFAPDADTSALHVADRVIVEASGGMLVVPVRTCRYAGCWLEDVNADGFRALRIAPEHKEDGAVVGALVPVAWAEAGRAATDAGLHAAGHFRFWHRALPPPAP